MLQTSALFFPAPLLIAFFTVTHATWVLGHQILTILLFCLPHSQWQVMEEKYSRVRDWLTSLSACCSSRCHRIAVTLAQRFFHFEGAIPPSKSSWLWIWKPSFHQDLEKRPYLLFTRVGSYLIPYDFIIHSHITFIIFFCACVLHMLLVGLCMCMCQRLTSGFLLNLFSPCLR